MVNVYIKSITGNDFTAKDFRTWAGTVQALIALRTTAGAETKTEIKNNVLQAVEQVAAHLGNTRAICKKYYIHPLIINLYENNLLEKYLADETNPLRSDQNHDLTDDLTDYLTDEEKILMKILNLEKVKSICVQH